MKPAADYFTATMPEPWQILGLRLRAFSLGHYKLLRRYGCGFVSDDDASATREDLILGVLVCSMSPAEFLSFVEEKGEPEINLPRIKKLWNWILLRLGLYKEKPRKIGFEEQVQEWGAKVGLFDLNEKAAMFKEYIEANSIMPKYWEEKQGGTSGAHWSQSVEVCLRSKLGWTQSEIDSEPLSKAFADYLKHAENEGAVKLMTPEEIALISARQEEASHGA